MTLDAEEFIRRFPLHVIPQGFMRIRHFGFLANRTRKHALPQYRKLSRGAGSGLSLYSDVDLMY